MLRHRHSIRIVLGILATAAAALAGLSGGCPADPSTNPAAPSNPVVAGDSAVNDGGGDAPAGGGSGGGNATSTSGGSSSGGGGAGAINAPQIVVAGWMNEPLRAVLVAAADRTADLTFELAGEPSPGGAADLFANPGADVTLVYTPVDDFVGDAFVTVNIRDGAASGTAIVRFRVLPKVEFALDRYEGEAPAGMLASATIPSGHTLPDDVELHWAFGDGSEATDPGTNMNRTHVFNSPGVYLVSLALLVGGVGGELGCTHASPGPANFTARGRSGGTGANQPPSAAAGADQNVIDEDGNGFALVTLSGGASSDPDGQIVAYTWAVEGGATYGPNPTPSTAISLGVGTWNITLTVMDDGGATASDTLRVVVGSSAILAISPDAPLSASGVMGGPFSPASQEYTITNSGDAPLTWSASHGQNWIDLSSAGGTLAAGASTMITVSITSAANSFLVGNYGGQISFANTASGAVLTRAVELSVVPAGGLLVSSGSLTSAGLVGGPFSPSSRNYTLTNTGSTAITWSATKTRPWVTLSAAGGTLAGGAAATVTVSLNSQANSLSAGVHSDTVSFANTTNGMGNATRSVSLTVSAPAMLNVSGTDLAASGPPGGPFSPVSTTYTLSNSGGVSLNWTAGANQAWLTVSPTSGTLAAGASTTVTASISSSANALAAGSYGASVSFTNTTNGAGNATRNASLNVTSVQMASSISQYGITWTFDRAYQVGQFVNGDWWVCPENPGGSVIVTSVSPAPTGSGVAFRNGSTVNPTMDRTGESTYQAYDGRVDGFRASDAAVFPLSLNTSTGIKSLVSTESILTFPHPLGTEPDPFPASYRTQSTQVYGVTQTALRNAAILTAVATPPSATTFRPPFVGTVKPLYDASTLRTHLLPSLARPVNSPSLATLERCLKRPWIDTQKREWMANCIAPINNQVGYGRDFANVTGDAILSLCMDYALAEKHPLLFSVVQLGIDHYHAAQLDSHLWRTNGGHRHGRKLPILFAGLMLNNTAILGVQADFQEDLATYYGDDRSPPQVLWTGWAAQPRPYSNVGSNNVLYQFEESPDSLGNSWDHEHIPPAGWAASPFPNNPPSSVYPFDKHEGYRRLVSYSWVGHALAARILNLKSSWQHDAFFDYVDRWMHEDDAPLRSAIAGQAVIENWNALVPDVDWTNPNVYYPEGRLCLSPFQRELYMMYRAGY
ncbi:MAG: hypothetical protein IT450_18760 [Phycisphaerales bacterium]|nr:hypothetical protein [Phycisphaerales bacterium]